MAFTAWRESGYQILNCIQKVQNIPGKFLTLQITTLLFKGHIYGMDVASGVAVQALGIEPNEHILELCCAPGNKLCMISDIQASLGEGFGSVTGVDIDERRLSNAKNLLKKYKAVTARLFLTGI